MPAERGKPDSRGLNFFDITDFSPGIYDSSLNIVSNPTGVTMDPGIFPAPPGASDIVGTFGCMALPTGGLGPLPAITYTNNLADLGVSTGADITCFTNSFQSTPDELIYGITPPPAGGHQTTTFYSYQIGIGVNQIQTATFTFVANKNFCAYPFTTSLYNSNDGVYQPVVCLPLTAPDGPNSILMVYPSVATPTAFGVDAISAIGGTAFGHQGRIVNVEINGAYGWPTALSRDPNELFSYTDPPLTETYPNQAEVFGPENPVGYGAINSVSAGELFCVKCRGGAIIVQGDLNNPTVTTLPGVQSTGATYGRSDTGEQGLYYCTESQGAWLWAGGNSSSKVSTQLDDGFFYGNTFTTDPTFTRYFVQRWGDWMLFNNNWILDTKTGGWWRLDDPSGPVGEHFWYAPGYYTYQMYTAPISAVNDMVNILSRYDRTVPRDSFTWQSLPIKIPAEDRTGTARELVIRASNPYGDAAPQIIATLIDDKGNTSVLDTWTMTTGINTIQETRLNAGLKQTTTVAIHLSCSGTLYAPVVHALSMGYRPREHVGIT